MNRTSEKLVSVAPVESVLPWKLDNLEPTLTCRGYHIRNLMEQFDARPTEIKAPLNNLLVSVRAMLQAGDSANAAQTARIDENTRVRKTIAA